jgi:hypothetical protein
VNQWIPVSDSLPQRNEFVLLRFANGTCDVGKWDGKGWGWVDPYGGEDSDLTPTYWMSLPDPPKNGN